jgi:hypothetical protein
VEGRVVPRQRLPEGGFQRGIDDERAPEFAVKFVYTPTSVPRVSEGIITTGCEAATENADRCRGL